MSRYTQKQFKADLPGLNKQLEAKNSRFFFVFGARNDYTAVDLATAEELKRHCCTNNLEAGSPKECLKACYQYISAIRNHSN